MKIAVITPICSEVDFGCDWHDFCYDYHQVGMTRAVGVPMIRPACLEIEIMKGLIFNPLFSDTGGIQNYEGRKSISPG